LGAFRAQSKRVEEKRCDELEYLKRLSERRLGKTVERLLPTGHAERQQGDLQRGQTWVVDLANERRRLIDVDEDKDDDE
jgi:hypothetical protein